MKKFLLLGTVGLALGLIGCTKEGYNESKFTIGGPALTIISSSNDGSVAVSYGVYAFAITTINYESTVELSSPDLIANNASLKFSGLEQAFTIAGYEYLVDKVKATAGATGMEINNDKFIAVPYYLYDNNYMDYDYGYYYTTADAAELTYTTSQRPNYITVAKYNIGSSYKVNTFQVNTFFQGKTTTTYPQSEEPFVTDGITYRFILNPPAENQTAYTATLIMYNAKFSSSEREPLKAAIIIEGLDVTFSPNGINIKGENIIPGIVEAGSTTPNENFMINSVEFNTTNEYYTTGTLDYTVAGIYKGHFEGSYLNSYFIK